jgi:hypothetical protein
VLLDLQKSKICGLGFNKLTKKVSEKAISGLRKNVVGAHLCTKQMNLIVELGILIQV